MAQFSTAMKSHGLECISIAPIEIHLKPWLCVGFEETNHDRGDFMHLAFIYDRQGDFLECSNLDRALATRYRDEKGLLLRIHSECLLGDAFGSTMCDCGEQLSLSLREMETTGRGILLYLRQEGRGIGMRNKLDCLALQAGFSDAQRIARRYSSDEANLALGHQVDHRSYEAAAGFLKALGVQSTRLITGNASKAEELVDNGVDVSEIIDIWTNTISPRAQRELAEKRSRTYKYARYEMEAQQG